MAEKLCNLNSSSGGSGASWQFLGKKTGTTSIALPSNFNQLLIEVVINNEPTLSVINIPILAAQLLSTSRRYRGGVPSANGGQAAVVDASLSSVTLVSALKDNTNVTSKSVISVYYQ